LYFLFGDHLGSTSLSYRVSDGYVARHLYKPWGEKRYPAGASELPTKYRFTGQYVQNELWLYYYNARWYDNRVGRFIQADTIVPEPGDTKAWDRFAYSQNNPTKYIDPSGHDVECPGMDDYEECVIKQNPVVQTIEQTSDQFSTDIPTNNPDTDENMEVPNETQEPNLQTINNSSLPMTKCIGKIGGCTEAISSNTSIIWGFNVSGSVPEVYKTSGMEEILLPDGTRATYIYGGEGSSIGNGASYTIYGGFIFNAKIPEDYFGNATGVGLTVSLAQYGITLAYVWNSNMNPLAPGNVQGIQIGYSPGAQISAWYSVVVYQILDIIP
jgi:RHS repeat-associated protein